MIMSIGQAISIGLFPVIVIMIIGFMLMIIYKIIKKVKNKNQDMIVIDEQNYWNFNTETDNGNSDNKIDIVTDILNNSGNKNINPTVILQGDKEYNIFRQR